MNLEKVSYLITAIEAGSFSLAAEKLGMTQSGLNRQITSLEDELKTTLLLRGRRGVVPAKGAEPVIARLRELLLAEKRVHEEIAAVKGLVMGELTIGSYFSISTTWLPPLLKHFSDAYPAITLSTVEGTDQELVTRLKDGTLDCAFLSQHSYDGDFFPLMETEFVAWLPPEHPLASRDTVTAEDITKEPFIYPRVHHNTDIDDFFTRHRTAPKTHLITKEVNRLKGELGAIHYVGIAADEAWRCKDERYPLVEWGITEAQALQACYDRGFDFGGLYEIYHRASCWCCPFQRIDELRKLRKHHPELWEKLLELDRRALAQFGTGPLGQFKQNWSVKRLDTRFAEEDGQTG